MFSLSDLSPVEILELTIIGEARGELIQGQVAVGSVVRNRLTNNTEKYKSFYDVCLEPFQFSCWNSNDPNYEYLFDLGKKINIGIIIQDPYLRQCILVAKGISTFDILDNTHGSLFYMENKLFDFKKPNWAKKAKNMVTIGNHTFFSL